VRTSCDGIMVMVTELDAEKMRASSVDAQWSELCL
jgi:hypothetical protein